MEYDHRRIEADWQKYWAANKTFAVTEDKSREKYYVLDMFPYPSGAGLHVGHPLGYIASDIYSRYKTLKGFNVLHPMGYDAFGLPAEQYAIETGQHPAITTEKNIARYREQLDKLGFSFDWDREVRTSDPKYYKWTQWTFLRLFESWFDKTLQKAAPINELVLEFEKNGNVNINAATSLEDEFTSPQWKAMDEEEKSEVLMHYRLAYLADTMVNWCPALGTVLANDEVSDGHSVRGGHPVVKKEMKQWSLRITAYADRLLSGFDNIDWPENVKEIQKNWIGKSKGASIKFVIVNEPDKDLEVFTTRPDTIFGVTFMSVAPEHPYVELLTTEENREAVEKYLQHALTRSERDRISDAKNISGVFTGSYAINPFNGKAVPVWVADYVLGGYGTGAVMAVPAHDSRDYAFAKHFGIPIVEVIKGGDIGIEAYESKDGICVNSGIFDGMNAIDAIEATIKYAEENGFGKGSINYRLRDAIFSRQRYWGEPFPVYYKGNIPYVVKDEELPVQLPEVDKYLPTEAGDPPLARAKDWLYNDKFPYEHSTMPGFAGSSAYYLRYMDPHNESEYFSQDAVNYWKSVDFYVGGAEHATGHLIYSRFWNKFLFDLGLTPEEEPFKKMVNQGMIQGRSNFVYRVKPEAMAEFVLWEMIRGKQSGVEFKQNFKEGHRRFDFYSEEAKILIEIKRQKSLEKLVFPYEEYAKENNYKILLFNIVDVILHTDKVLKRIKKAVAGEDVPVMEEIETWEEVPIFISANIPGREEFSYPIHVDINLVDNDVLDIDAFRKWRPENEHARFILEKDKYVCGWEVEKMSKSKYNVQNPDDLVEKYGADTLRMYEMFLGPIEQSKPWDTKGIEGVYRFLKKYWRLHFDHGKLIVTDDAATDDELKVLHKCIKKIGQDIERFSLNTCISSFMIATNELSDLKCHKREILEPIAIIMSPFAPHVAEELWKHFGHQGSISKTVFPDYNEDYLKESEIAYPISFNGKRRFELLLPADASKEDIEKAVLNAEESVKWLEGKAPKKVIIVPGKIVNIVV
ncbi:MAG: leucine--tRNA ligase [Bacteroidales bacterium]|nr:leucine--tRNA ligase [Bacteroidales bacterium]